MLRRAHSPRHLVPHHHHHHHGHIPTRRDLVTQRRSHHDGREPWYGDSIYDPSDDDGDLFSGSEDDDDDSDGDNGSLASLPTLSSLSRLPHIRATRRHGHGHHNHHDHRHGHRHGRDALGPSDYDGRGGGINRVPGMSPRDGWRTGLDVLGVGVGDRGWHSGDDGVNDHGSYHRRRPEEVAEESW